MNKIQKTFVTIIGLLMAVSTWADTAYTITINPATGSGSGTITANATTSIPGRTIILTSHPASGSFLSKLTVTPFEDGGGAQSRRANPTILSTIALTPRSDGTYAFIMPNCNVEVDAEFATATNISGATITLVNSQLTYDFSAHQPVINHVKYGSTTLTEGTDYTVDPIGTITDVGTIDVTIRGIGKYTGQKSATFSIVACPITSAAVTLAYAATTYNRGVQKPAVQTIYVGGHLLTEGNTYDYTYSYPADCTNQGSKTVTITGHGNFSGTTTATYTIERKPINESMVGLSGYPTGLDHFIYTGSQQTPTVTVTDGTMLTVNTEYTVSYSTDKTNIGSKIVRVVGQGNYTGEVILPYRIEGESAFTVALTSSDAIIYDGTAKIPAVTVKRTSDNQVLTLNTDYSINYLNNIDAGTATIIVTGINNYTGTQTLDFTIVRKTLTDGMFNDLSNVTYNGSEQKQGVVVATGYSLLENEHFIISYPSTSYINQGSGKQVKITGIGNYQGDVTKTYTINKLSLISADVTLDTQGYIYDGSDKEPQPIVRVGSLVVPSTDYTTTYTSNQNAGENSASVTVTATTAGNYSDAITTYFSISRKALTEVMVSDMTTTQLVFTGSAHTPEPTVVDGIALTLTKNTDYELTYYNNTNVGTATVKVSGLGNYQGDIIRTFSIIANGTAQFTVDWETEPSYTYDGNAKTPRVVVKNSSHDVLTEDVDYTLTYSNHINAGEHTASVRVDGKGNYGGYIIKPFSIGKKTLTASMVTLSADAYTYNGNIQKPTVTVSDGNLMEDADYTISNPDHTNADTYTITVTGTRNYTGSVEKQYTISSLSIVGASVTLATTNYVYDGLAHQPAVTEVKIGTFVVPTTGYTTGYQDDCTNHGTKIVTITGQNNFTGSQTANYTISPKTVTSDMIILSSTNLNYTGLTVKPTVTVKDGATDMTVDTDYTLVNDGAVNVGNYSVSITGQGNYTSQASKGYSIVAAGASGFTVGEIANQTYTGANIEPTIIVKDGSTTLTENTHYHVTYSENKNVGQATITVTGIESAGYSGVAVVHFNITPKTLTTDMVTLTATSFVYNGELQKPGVTVSDGSAITANDYIITNGGGINVNTSIQPTYSVNVAGTNNYTGEVTKTFNITQLPITDARVTLYQLDSYVYDGTAKRPGVREVITENGDGVVVPTVGYDVDWTGNVNVGTATVTVTGKGNFSGLAQTTFSITKKPLTSSMIALDQENFTYTGDVQKPVVTVSDGTIISASDYTIVNEGGTETGNYTVTVRATAGGNYQGEATRSYSIVGRDAGTSTFTMTLEETSVEYDGTFKMPAVTIKDGTKTLLLNTDYTINYSDNKNVGTALVTVTGKGNYAGTRSTTFEITKKPLTAAMVTITGYTVSDGFIYNAANQKPEVTVRDGTIMTASDYVITNNGGTNQGTYHVIVTATGNYSGEIDQTFVIRKRSLEGATVVLYELSSYVYDGTAKKPGVKEVAFGEDVIPTAGYTVAYSANIDAGEATVTITGQGNYSGVLTSQFTINRKEVTADMIKLSNNEYVYNGAVQKPIVVLMDNGTEMKLDTDYTLTNNGGTLVGKYDVVAVGKGNYTGMATQNFNIISKGIGAFEVTMSTEQVEYTGSEHRPTVTVKDGSVTLIPGSQYTVSYKDNTNAGTATVTISGQGEYSGTSTKTFLIKPKPLTEDMVFLSSSSYTYNTLQQKPTVTVSDQSFLTANDYILTNDGGVDHGDYDVVVIGRNNYTGTITKQFSILPQNIENAKVVLYEMSSYVYDGTPKNPGVREVDIGNTIIPVSSYTTEISANVNVGTVTVTVTGLENFTGTAKATFEILPKPLSEQMLMLSADIFYYNGELQKPEVTLEDGETTLTIETDYTLVNEGGREPGVYEVVATGKGNYTGTATKTYQIARSDIEIDITVEDAEKEKFYISLIVGLADEYSQNVIIKGLKIPEEDKEKQMSLTIPATCEAEGVTYAITEIAANAFSENSQLTDLYLPETEEPLTIGENAVPSTTVIHTSLALLDNYSLMPSLSSNFRANKVMTTVTPRNRFWTFSCGVDVYVPKQVKVFSVQERSETAVAIIELDKALHANGVRMIKSNNGVLIAGESEAVYNMVACARRMSSGTFISTGDFKDYGEENLLEPVIEPTHYENDYYILKDNKFCSIKLEDEAVKVPAGKAVLHLPAVAQGRSYSTVLDVINEGTTSVSEEVKVNSEKFATADWYDLNGRKIEGRPVKKGVYIVNGKKVVIK